MFGSRCVAGLGAYLRRRMSKPERASAAKAKSESAPGSGTATAPGGAEELPTPQPPGVKISRAPAPTVTVLWRIELTVSVAPDSMRVLPVPVTSATCLFPWRITDDSGDTQLN